MHIISGPLWFHGLDYAFEIIAFLITFFIAFYSFRIFLLTWERKYMYFTLAFLSVSGAYALRAVMDWFIYRNLLPNVPNLAAAVTTVVATPALHELAIVISSFFLLSGFLLLTALIMGLKDAKVLLGLEAVLVLITALYPFIFHDMEQFVVMVHLLLVLMLVIIVIHQIQNYLKHKAFTAMLVLIGMCALLLAHISYFIIPYISQMFYGVGHGLQLFGYVMLLANMLLVLKK